MNLSHDALVFGFSYLNNPNSTLSFGGEGSDTIISDRARAALNELLAADAAEVAPADTQIIGREYYKGKVAIGPLLKEAKLNLFGPGSHHYSWTTFSKI